MAVALFVAVVVGHGAKVKLPGKPFFADYFNNTLFAATGSARESIMESARGN